MQAIRIIQEEHRSLAAVLHGMLYLVHEIRDRGMKPPFEVLGAMVYYIDAFPERFHHPKEDKYLFLRLRARCPAARTVARRARGGASGRRRKDPHARAEPGALSARRRCGGGTLHRRGGGLRRIPLGTHGARGEGSASARRETPDAGDWEAIDAAFTGHADPLVGESSGEDYRKLFRKIVNLAPPPIGLGPPVSSRERRLVRPRPIASGRRRARRGPLRRVAGVRASRGARPPASPERQRNVPRVPRRQGRQRRRRQVDRRRRRRVRPIGARRDAAQMHRLPRRRLRPEAAASREAQARRLRALPREGGQGVQRDGARHGAQGRQHRRRDVHRLPRPARHQAGQGSGVAHQSREPRSHVRQVSRQRRDGGERQAARRQHRQPVPRQHSRQGADGRRSGAPRRPAPTATAPTRSARSPIRTARRTGRAFRIPAAAATRRSGRSSRRASTARCGRKATWQRRAATTATARIASSSTPVASFQTEVIKECGNCHADYLSTYRDTFHGQVTALGLRAHGDLRLVPRLARDPARVESGVDGLARKTGSRPARSAMPAPPRTSPTTTRTRTGTIARAIPLYYYAALFMEWLLIGVFSFFGIHTLLWFVRSLRARFARGSDSGKPRGVASMSSPASRSLAAAPRTRAAPAAAATTAGSRAPSASCMRC